MSRGRPGTGGARVERARGTLPSGSRPAPDDIHVGQGDVIGGRYQLLDERGRGGVGVVWRAIDGKTQSHVAVKLLAVPPSDERGASFADRFRRATRALHDVRHPGIVRVLDVQAEGEPGLPYIVLEWLHGKSWREQRETERVRDFDDELAILLQVADALTALHAAKIAHRDIKPDNIFLSRSIALDGDTVVTARLIDFDLVKVREGRAETDTRTAGLGTVDYMAPEQFEGGDVDVRVDVWALGVLLFEILTGRKPFEGRVDYEVAAKVIRDPVPSLDALSGRVDGRLLDLCRSLLEKSPAKRPMDGAARTRALLATLLQARGDRIDDRLPPEPDADRFESDVKKQFKTAMSMHWRAAGSSSSKDEPSASPPRTSETWPYWAATSVAAAVCAGALTWGAVRPTETVRPSRLRVESNVAGAEVFVGGARKGAISASNHAATVELDPQGALHNVELRCGTKILDSVSLDFANSAQLPLVMRVGGAARVACDSPSTATDGGVGSASESAGPTASAAGASTTSVVATPDAGSASTVPWAACVGAWTGGYVRVTVLAAPDSSGVYVRARDDAYTAVSREPPTLQPDGWRGRVRASDWGGSYTLPCTGAADEQGRYTGPDGTTRLRRSTR